MNAALQRAGVRLLHAASAGMKWFDGLDPRLQGAIVLVGIVLLILGLALADFLLARALAWREVRRAIRERQRGTLRWPGSR